MTRILQSNSVEETKLWKILSKSVGNDAKYLSVSVSSLCIEAIDRMKAMYVYASQYTLHDDRHFLRTTELMGQVLGTEAENLNVVELTLLILSAFFHDQGMVLTEEEFSALDSNHEYQLYRDNWLIEHPNYRETAKQLNSSFCTEDFKIKLSHQIRELETALLTDYIRETHGHRSAEFIRMEYGKDKRMQIHNVNLARLLAQICESHTVTCDHITPQNGYRYDEQVGTYRVNVPFLSVVLRIADILDFDRDRTPDPLLKSIHFTSSVSLMEWEKHRSVEGWQISPNLIRYTLKCKHPAYEAAARKYMDWIDKELIGSKQICDMQPREIKGYEFNLPLSVDRSRIEPLDSAYQFHNLEFNLSRDEVVRLLMTDKLFGRKYLCIRELLQNSLDALRYRRALNSHAGTKWNKGRVEFRHYVNTEGYEVLECNDNGTGMDEYIIKNHFVRIGRSFYRSPFFDRERNSLKTSGNDFDPCSQFGFGFMSCFMIGDRITISTRRDYGAGREYGPPLIVEIHGLSGLLIVRKGLMKQPIGTTVSIVSRQKPSLLDTWTDQIQLCRVLKGYALATEFPITGICEIPEIKEEVKIPVSPEIKPTLIEIAKIKNFINIRQDLSKVSTNLQGYARDSFLVDENGLPCLSNTEAEWLGKKEGSRKKWDLVLLPDNRGLEYDYYKELSVPVCLDGILVAGPPGRHSHSNDVRMRLGSRNSYIYSHSPVLIDVRGDLKPEITPARIPPDHIGPDLPPGWQRLSNIFKEGLGLLWEKLANYLRKGLSPEVFWKLSIVYEISIGWIPYKTLWETLQVPLVKNNQKTIWKYVRELGNMSMCLSNEYSFILKDKKGYSIGPNLDLKSWEINGEERPHLCWSMNSVTLLMSCLDIRDGKIKFSPSPPSSKEIPLAHFIESAHFEVNYFVIKYVGNASDAFAIQTAFPTTNRDHVLIQNYLQSPKTSEPNELLRFTRAFMACITESISSKKDSPSLDQPGYWHKRIGHLFFSVRWDQYDKSLRPPYKLWTEDKKWFFIQEKDFLKWRDLTVSID